MIRFSSCNELASVGLLLLVVCEGIRRGPSANSACATVPLVLAVEGAFLGWQAVLSVGGVDDRGGRSVRRDAIAAERMATSQGVAFRRGGSGASSLLAKSRCSRPLAWFGYDAQHVGLRDRHSVRDDADHAVCDRVLLRHREGRVQERLRAALLTLLTVAFQQDLADRSVGRTADRRGQCRRNRGTV